MRGEAVEQTVKGKSSKSTSMNLLSLREQIKTPRWSGQAVDDRIVSWIFNGPQPLAEKKLKYLDENKVRVKKLFGLDGNLERALVDAKETIERKSWCWWC